MSKFFSTFHKKMVYYGFDAKKFMKALKPKSTDWIYRDLNELKKQKGDDKTFKFGAMYPFATDKDSEAGLMKGHYFHQDLYVARQIFQKNPEKHLDIGSRVDGFVAHVASFRPIELIDIREISSKVKNISFRQADLMELPADLMNYCDSVSSLHVIEHFGLGRYGDPIDYFGYLKAISNISKILVGGGTFYFSVPIGPQRIEFNAHRVFSVAYLLQILSNEFIIDTFSYINDKGDFFEDVELTEQGIKTNFSCNFGCGVFILKKR